MVAVNDRPDGQFRLAGSAELARDEDVQFGVQTTRDFEANQDAASRQRKNQRIPEWARLKATEELPAGVLPILEHGRNHTILTTQEATPLPEGHCPNL